jgi:cellulose synthase/poly-beta-1,6-N-acetylglucosamine synthase-like glycosyltransferase
LDIKKCHVWPKHDILAKSVLFVCQNLHTTSTSAGVVRKVSLVKPGVEQLTYYYYLALLMIIIIISLLLLAAAKTEYMSGNFF